MVRQKTKVVTKDGTEYERIESQQPGAHKNGEFALLERRKNVTEMYLEGKPQYEIAQLLGVSQTAVWKDLEAVRKEWMTLAVVNFDEVKSQELAKLDNLERVAWAAWHRSCEDAQFKRRRVEEARRATPAGKDDQGKQKYTSRMVPVKKVEEETSQGRDGDPKFLERIGWCIEQRLRIAGAYKQAQGAGPVVQVPWEELYERARAQDPIEARIAAAEREGRLLESPSPQAQSGPPDWHVTTEPPTAPTGPTPDTPDGGAAGDDTDSTPDDAAPPIPPEKETPGAADEDQDPLEDRIRRAEGGE